MIVYLNGNFVPAAEAQVSVFDRGFLYGDALFETLRIQNGRPFQWEAHAARLLEGALALGISLPPTAALAEAVTELCRRNATTEAILRINISRGQGHRGYSPQGAGPATTVLSLHPAPALAAEPATWRLATSSIRLANSPTATPCKHSNKLPNILARAEAERVGADEALMLDSDGFVAEGSSSNVFWLRDGVIFTPPSNAVVLSGVTQAFILEWCSRNGLPAQQKRGLPGEFLRAEAVFMTLSTWGVVEAIQLDSKPLARSQLVHRLYQAWLATLRHVEP